MYEVIRLYLLVQMLDGLRLLVCQRQPFQKQSLLSMLNEPGLNFLASLWSWADWFESHFVGNPEGWFCRVEAHANKLMQHIFGIDARKPVFGVSEKARLKPVSSATKTS